MRREHASRERISEEDRGGVRQKDVNNIAHVWPGETKVGNANNAPLPKGITKT